MTDRDRLIELFQEMDKDFGITCPNINTNKSCKGCKYQISGAFIDCDYLARKVDYLLANGVIVPVRCENCDYYIPKSNFNREYDNPLGYDGVCDNCDKYTDKDDFCSCAKLKEREGK